MISVTSEFMRVTVASPDLCKTLDHHPCPIRLEALIRGYDQLLVFGGRKPAETINECDDPPSVCVA
jgi:hypothetical protein